MLCLGHFGLGHAGDAFVGVDEAGKQVRETSRRFPHTPSTVGWPPPDPHASRRETDQMGGPSATAPSTNRTSGQNRVRRQRSYHRSNLPTPTGTAFRQAPCHTPSSATRTDGRRGVPLEPVRSVDPVPIARTPAGAVTREGRRRLRRATGGENEPKQIFDTSARI